MIDIFKKIGPLPRHINSPSYDLAIKMLAEEYGLEIHTFNSIHNHNGWIIPPKYHVKNATIKFNGELIYDGCAHPLGVISYSTKFSGRVTKDELLKHCFYDHRNEEWIPYHFRQSYRPWDRDWGFCLPKKIIKNLQEGFYDVEIDIEEGVEELKIGRGFIKGKSDLNIALCAHLDHPGLVNDDLSGVVVILEAFKRLKSLSLNYGLEVFIVPEIIGTQFYLNKNPVPFEGLFVESVGQGGEFCLQQSLDGKSLMDAVAGKQTTEKYFGKLSPFKSVYGNDEINFESFGCSMPSLTRGDFHGYHSSEDNINNI
jgi:aminopeptidase-like protein